MSTLTPSLTKGLQVFNGSIPLRTSDDASDNFVAGVYSHLPIEWSATEANEIKSFMLYLQSIVANSFSFPVVNESGSVIIAGPVRITGYNATLERFKVVLADADANAPAQLLLLSSLETDSTWADAETYATTQSIHPTVPNGCRYVCSIAGDSGGTEPTWTTGIGDTIVDNEVTWTCYADAVAYPAGEFTSATDTSGATIGDALYLSDTGGTTLTPPSGADKIVQEIGRVQTLNNPGLIAGKICAPVGLGTSWLNAQAVTMAKLVRSANAGAPLLGGGASADSAYGPLNLAGGANVVNGVLPESNTFPSQTGNSGKVLQTNGTSTSWQTAGGDSTIRATKVSTTTRTSSTSISDDPDLKISLAASHKYKIKLFIKAAVQEAAAGNKLSVRWNYTGAGSTFDINMVHGSNFYEWPDTLLSNSASGAQSVYVNVDTSSNNTVLYTVDGIVTTNGAGDFSLQWTSTSSDHVGVYLGSTLEAIVTA